MDVFYGAAIQGVRDRSERVQVNREFIDEIKACGYRVLTEHTVGETRERSWEMLEESIGPLPKAGIERTRYVRDKMIGFVEADISAAVFEVSVPSLGTGIEFAHAYLRPRMGLSEIPILTLYERDYWPNKLSSMITGVNPETAPGMRIAEYSGVDEGKDCIRRFLDGL